MNFPVVLITVFSVPEGKEEEFFVWWNEVKEAVDISAWIHQRKTSPEPSIERSVQLY